MLSCNNPKRSKGEVGNTDSIVLKEIINKTYSKIPLSLR